MSDESSNDDDLDFDRPKIKPPNPEGFVKKKGRSNKKDKHRKRKKSGERDLHRANRVDERRERHIKSQSPSDKRAKQNHNWRQNQQQNYPPNKRDNYPRQYNTENNDFEVENMRNNSTLMSSVMRNRKDKESKRHYRNEGNNRIYQPLNYRSGNDVTESRQRDDDKRSNKSITSSSVSASGTNLSKHSGSSDSFTPDDRKEAKKELERIQRRIAELKGTRVDGEDEDNNKTTEPAERADSYSTTGAPLKRKHPQQERNGSGVEGDSSASGRKGTKDGGHGGKDQGRALIDAEVEDVSASESDHSSSSHVNSAVEDETNEEGTNDEDTKGVKSSVQNEASDDDAASSSEDSDDEDEEFDGIKRRRLLPAAYSSKFDNLDSEKAEKKEGTRSKTGKQPSSASQSNSPNRKHNKDRSPEIQDIDALNKPSVQTQQLRKPKEPEKAKLPVYFPALQGCRSVDEFKHLNRIEEGTYGVVYRAQDLRTNEIVALKRLKMEKEREGFPITSLREINCLLKSQHPNVVPVREIVVGSNMDKIYLVMDYVEHDLKALMETMKQPFLIGETKTIMLQLLEGVKHLHDNWILHRDLKASNLLFSHKGELKIGDFGLAREYGSPLKPYTPIVVTLWYRAPELLLGTKLYSKPIDMWSVGCIFGELLAQKAMFAGKSETEQLNLIFKELGTPNEKIWPEWPNLPLVKKIAFTEYPYNNLRKRFGTSLTENGIALMNRFLTYDPKRRISADDAIKHEFFKENPRPVDPSQFPTWPAKSEGAATTKRAPASPKAPEGGDAYNKLLANEDDAIGGFQLTNATAGLAKRGPGFHLKF